MDRYTFYMLEFLEDIHPASKTNMNDLVSLCYRVCPVWSQLPHTCLQEIAIS